ncbi:dynein light chain Tctex-type 5-B-like [Montipora capricornis]|uniref:dynein light chain Tctex-type 5-B-like n=1 Tax=Montipora foliosa TaxID=591990 RepID=UPI0035F1C1B9
MFKGKFRDQQHGSFEKSLRQALVTTTGGQQKGQSTKNEHITKSPVLYEGKQKLAMNEEEKRTVFYAHEIKKIMDDILQEKLSNQTYEATTCRTLCMTLSDVIKGRVKGLGMQRFRFICNVTIGSNSGQGLLIASRFLWDEFIDNFSTSSFQNSSLFAVAIVFGILKE